MQVAALGAGGEVSKGSLPDAPSELTVTSRKNKGAVVPQRPSSATARRVRSGKEQEVGGEASAVSLFAEISLSSMGSDAEEAEEEDSAAEVAPSAQVSVTDAHNCVVGLEESNKIGLPGHSALCRCALYPCIPLSTFPCNLY